jgi:demethylmenaquinone methyltransferase/2-methoxy-6-polyprenyl-1,4-benzoquinol methylase
VRGVFDSVASRYDIMNDVLSMGLHRVWKAYTVAVAGLQPGMQGAGHCRRHRRPGPRLRPRGPTGLVVLTDINEAMLRTGRDRLLDEGLVMPTVACDAEHMPFAERQLRPGQRGLRPAQHDPQGAALAEMCRVLRPGGRLLVLEFSGAPRRCCKSPTTGIRSS